MPTYKVTNHTTGQTQTQEFEDGTSLADARIVLDLGDEQAFAGKSGEALPQDREDKTDLEAIASGNEITIVAASAGSAPDEDSIFDDDASDDIADYQAKGQSPEVADPVKPKLPEVADPVSPKLPEVEDVSLPKKPSGAAPDITGGGGSPVQGGADSITTLTRQQKAVLLRNNRVVVDEGVAKLCAFVMRSGSGALDWAPQYGVFCSEGDIGLDPHLGLQSDGGSSSYSEVEHEWQKQSAGGAEVSFGIPKIFKFKTSYSYSDTDAGNSVSKRIYFQFSHCISTGRLSLNLGKLKVADEFLDAIKAAIKEPETQRAEKLLGVFEIYGQFIATDSVLGGRVTLTKSETVVDKTSVQRSFHEFQTAASGSFAIEAVPVEGSAGVSYKLTNKTQDRLYLQNKNLQLKTVGGDKIYDLEKLSQQWLPTINQSDKWQVIGFLPNSLVPITEVLPTELKKTCEDILRSYFLQQLQEEYTKKIGNTRDGDRFNDHVKYDWRIKKMCFRYDKVLDSIHTEWEVNGKTVEQGDRRTKNERWHGGARDDKSDGDAHFTLKEGEEISSVEVLTREDGILRAVRFHTTDGRSFPESRSDWYGGNKQAGDKHSSLSAHRIRGFCGNHGNYIDSLGFIYFDLKAGTKSPEFLQTIEEYLFS